MIKAIIFDFDGVIVESVDIKTRAFTELFASDGDDVVREVLKYHTDNTGVSRFDKFKYIYSNILHRELTNLKFTELCNNFSTLVAAKVAVAPYVKGSKEFLDSGMGKYKYFIASATPQSEIEVIIRKRKMDHYFCRVFGAPYKKYNAVKDIINKHSMKPSHIVYVGDALSDYEAAAINGINFIARLKDNEQLFESISCPKIRDLTSLKNTIKKMDSVCRT